MKKIVISTVVLIVLGVGYWLVSPLWRNVVLDEGSPVATGVDFVLGKGVLIPKEHEVAGEASFVKSGADTFLRFQNLKTVNGPDLRIYLAASLDAKDFVDLGPIRATEGNVNYKIPAGTDLSKYTYAMIWCRAFSVLFSYAEIK